MDLSDLKRRLDAKWTKRLFQRFERLPHLLMGGVAPIAGVALGVYQSLPGNWNPLHETMLRAGQQPALIGINPDAPVPSTG